METKPRRRKLDDLAQTLKAAALHYGSVVLVGTGPVLEEAERKLKLAALAFYQASRNEEEDKAISTLLALEQSDVREQNNALEQEGEPNTAMLGFAEDDHELPHW